MTDDHHSTTAAGQSGSAAHLKGNGADPEISAETERGGESWFDRLLSALGLKQTGTLRESLASVLADDDESGALFTAEERRLLRNILHLRDLRIHDVMVPRADIDAVDENVPLYALLEEFRKAGHSRMPVYRETLDDPLGFVHIKDVAGHIAERASAAAGEAGGLDFGSVDLGLPLKEIGVIRPILFVPPSMPAVDLMGRMRAARVQLALVIDEYGGTDGLVSLEDLVETVVGDIEDEHDEDDEPMFMPAGEAAWTADARLALEDFEEETGLGLGEGDFREHVDTLGGLVFALLGRIPVRGELISSPELPGFEFEVLDADPRRIRRLKVYRRAPAGAGAEDSGEPARTVTAA